jgi:hypothetical protein
MQTKVTLVSLLAAVVAVSACGKMGFGQDKGNNGGGASLSDTSDGIMADGQKAPSAEISLEDLNNVIAKIDPLKLMKRLGKTGDFDFETKKISTSSASWLDSRLECQASDSSLSDVKCAVIGYRAKEIAQFPPGKIGTYFFTNETLTALCDVAPGDWVRSNQDSRLLVKPAIIGLPWGCSKFAVPGF